MAVGLVVVTMAAVAGLAVSLQILFRLQLELYIQQQLALAVLV